MPARNQSLDNRIALHYRVAAERIAAVVVMGMVALFAAHAAVGDEQQTAGQTEQWGPRQGDRQTRLVPLGDNFTLGQPMKFRLELKNVGQNVIYYDTQQIDINGSLEVRDPQGRILRYTAQSFQTMRGKLPALLPGNVVYLFDGLDIDSQYLIVKPGKYAVQFSGYGAPKSNTVEIDIRPGELPPIKRIAARLLEVVPSNWELSVHGFPHESDRVRACFWDEPPAGWESVRGMPTIELRGNPSKEGSVYAKLWLSERKLKWIGAVDRPGQSAANHYGKCPEGYLYGFLPSNKEAATADWPAFDKAVKQAIQVEKEAVVPWIGAAKTDEELKHYQIMDAQDSLVLDNTQITDAGLKHLERMPQLKTLWLRRARITDQGLLALGKLPQLRRMFLDGDNITDAGLGYLKEMTKLEGISLDDTKITDAGLQKLKGLTQLEFISLCNTAVSDAGLETLGQFARLRSLELDGTKITDAGLQRLKGLTGITRLSLANTQITDAGLESLAGLTRLTSLDLDGTRVTTDGVRRLQRGLPQCELYYKSAEERRRAWENRFKEW